MRKTTFTRPEPGTTLQAGEYLQTPEFVATGRTGHAAVFAPYSAADQSHGLLVAVTGPVNHAGSQADARLFAGAVEMFDLLQHVEQLLGATPPTDPQARLRQTITELLDRINTPTPSSWPYHF